VVGFILEPANSLFLLDIKVYLSYNNWMNHHKRKIRVFHPRKLWLGLAMLALTLGVGAGELYSQAPNTEVLVAQKMTRNMQTFSLSGLVGAKQGYSRETHKVSYLDATSANALEKHDEALKSGVKSVCFIAEPIEEATYTADIVEVKISDHIASGAEFRVEVYVKNTGTAHWYGADSKCPDKTVVNLGTAKQIDRASRFFEEGHETGWIGNNRIRMVEDIAKSGEVATFAFTAIAPDVDTIFQEHFNLVAEGTTWFENFDIPVDIRIGNTTAKDDYELQFLKDVSIDTASLEGAHKIKVDLSEQKMTLLIGEIEVYHLTVSTGAYDTPTPVGNYRILNQQELRVGGAAPHYRMPYWQGFTKWGHGLHALPYLGDPGGWFWEEALDHIGLPVSHGCIRMLPDDAVVVYEFGDIGMEIEIAR